MPYQQVRNIIYTMHTAHEDFAEVRQQLGITSEGLNYEKIRDGQLSPDEEKFLKEYVVPDLNGRATVPHNNPHSLSPKDYGSIHIEVADPDKSDFTVADLRSRSELIFSKTPFSSIFVDHAGLMASRKKYSSTTEKLNEVIRDLKRLAMSFNRGMGLAVICLFQISREGFKQAEKTGGRYNLTHLSYANECERSADIVTATYIDDDLRKIDRAIFQCLKSRDQKPFERTPVRVVFPCRRLVTDDTMTMEEIDQRINDSRDEHRGNQNSRVRESRQVTPNLDFDD
jgi:hypothetical protein